MVDRGFYNKKINFVNSFIQGIIKMKGIVKANTVDKYLYPIRKQIIGLIELNSTVLEFGCGNGDLLFKLSSKIRTGIGFDKSQALITYANNRKEKENIKNLDFKVIDLTKESLSTYKFDYSVTSLLFHILNWENALELLNKKLALSRTTIVCGFCKPTNTKQSTLLWLDQRFTSHYHNYLTYKNNGFTKGLIETIENVEYTEFDTFDPVIKIYKITQTFYTD